MKVLFCCFCFHLQLTMNDFSVHRIIGRGGFGEVYGCRKADTGKMWVSHTLWQRWFCKLWTKWGNPSNHFLGNHWKAASHCCKVLCNEVLSPGVLIPASLQAQFALGSCSVPCRGSVSHSSWAHGNVLSKPVENAKMHLIPVIPPAIWKGLFHCWTCASQSSLWELQGQPWVVFNYFCGLTIDTPPLIIRFPFLDIIVPLCSVLNIWAWIEPVVLNINLFLYLHPSLSSCFSPHSFSPQPILKHFPSKWAGHVWGACVCFQLPPLALVCAWHPC